MARAFWLRVRDGAAEAIGSMVVLLPPPQIRALAPHLLPGNRPGSNPGLGPGPTVSCVSLAGTLLPGLLAAARRERERDRFAITAALWSTLHHCEACSLGRELHADGLLLPALTALHSSARRLTSNSKALT